LWIRAAALFEKTSICTGCYEAISEKLPGVAVKDIEGAAKKHNNSIDSLHTRPGPDDDDGEDDTAMCSDPHSSVDKDLVITENQGAFYEVEEMYDALSETQVYMMFKKSPTELRLRGFKVLTGHVGIKQVYPVYRGAGAPTLRLVTRVGTEVKKHVLPMWTKCFSDEQGPLVPKAQNGHIGKSAGRSDWGKGANLREAV